MRLLVQCEACGRTEQVAQSTAPRAPRSWFTVKVTRWGSPLGVAFDDQEHSVLVCSVRCAERAGRELANRGALFIQQPEPVQ